MSRKKVRLIFIFLRALAGIILLDLSQGASNLLLEYDLSGPAVTGTALILGAAGILLILSAFLGYRKIKKEDAEALEQGSDTGK